MAPMDQLPPLLSVKPGATLLAMLSDNTDRDQATRSWHGSVMERASACQSPRTDCGVCDTGQETSTIGVYGPNASIMTLSPLMGNTSAFGWRLIVRCIPSTINADLRTCFQTMNEPIRQPDSTFVI